MKNKKIKRNGTFLALGLTLIFTFSVCNMNNNTMQTSSSNLISDKKMEWGLKRGSNHEQPDVGTQNKSILDKYEGISIGNNEKPYIYLTFDCGYEAGYTEKILEVLKQNDVKATFFITGHYFNSALDMVQKMIEDGHIIR